MARYLFIIDTTRMVFRRRFGLTGFFNQLNWLLIHADNRMISLKNDVLQDIFTVISGVLIIAAMPSPMLRQCFVIMITFYIRIM